MPALEATVQGHHPQTHKQENFGPQFLFYTFSFVTIDTNESVHLAETWNTLGSQDSI